MAKQTITITLYKSELIYDIQNKTYLTGRSRFDGNNHEAVANMQANDDDENVNQLLRSLGDAYTMLNVKLGEYMDDSSTSSNDILMASSGTIVLVLSVPSNFNKAVVAKLGSAFHQYLVHSAVGEWFAITNKDDAADYVAKAAVDLAMIREAINKRVRPSRSVPSGGDDVVTEYDLQDVGEDNDMWLVPSSAILTPLTEGKRVTVSTDHGHYGLDMYAWDGYSLGEQISSISQTPYVFTARDREEIEAAGTGSLVFSAGDVANDDKLIITVTT